MEEQALDQLRLVRVVRISVAASDRAQVNWQRGEIEMLVFMKNLAGVKFDRVADAAVEALERLAALKAG